MLHMVILILVTKFFRMNSFLYFLYKATKWGTVFLMIDKSSIHFK